MLKVRIYDFDRDELGGENGCGNKSNSSAPWPFASAPEGEFGGSAELANSDLTEAEEQDFISRG
jgi:hypothetical protein